MDIFPILSALIWSLLASVSLPLNILALVVLRRTRRIEPATKVFLISLTVAGVGMCVGYVVHAIGISISGDWPYGHIPCLVQAFVLENVSQSIFLSMLAVNIERYAYIVHPLKYQSYFCAFRAKLIVVAIWVFVILLKCPVGLMSVQKVTFDPHHQLCYLISPFSATRFPTYVVINMTACFLPLLAVLVIYARILRFARKHARRMRRSIPDHCRQAGPVKRGIKGATTCFLLTVSIMVAMLPITIMYIMETSGHALNQYVIFAGHVAFTLGGIFDVVIYYLRNTALQVLVKQIMKPICGFL